MKNKLFKSLLFITVLLLILSSCSANKNSMASDRLDGYGGVEEKFDAEMAPETNNASSTGSILDSSSSTNITNAPASTNRKIIENIRLSVQTKEFDKLLNDLNSQITAIGGYVENSSISGREIDSTKNRSADFSIRIPCQTTASFTEFISANSVVINESVSTQDVTLSYVDMESRVAALESEKAALEKLLDSATTMSDIVDIRDKLTDVIYEIESYKSKLRTYDNLVDYSTVTIHIYEVERTAIVEKQTVFQKISSNLKTNFENVWDGAVSIFIFIISAIPYLIPISIVAIIASIIIRTKIKKKKIKKEEIRQ